MIVSGMSLFLGAADRLVLQNRADLSFGPFSGGLETKLQWKHGWFVMEFENRVDIQDLLPAMQGGLRNY